MSEMRSLLYEMMHATSLYDSTRYNRITCYLLLQSSLVGTDFHFWIWAQVGIVVLQGRKLHKCLWCKRSASTTVHYVFKIRRALEWYRKESDQTDNSSLDHFTCTCCLRSSLYLTVPCSWGTWFIVTLIFIVSNKKVCKCIFQIQVHYRQETVWNNLSWAVTEEKEYLSSCKVE